MKFSDSIEIGAFKRGPGPTFASGWDVWAASFAGLAGREGAGEEVSHHYHHPPWPVGFGTDIEYAVRLMVIEKFTWARLISTLRAAGL